MPQFAPPLWPGIWIAALQARRREQTLRCTELRNSSRSFACASGERYGLMSLLGERLPRERRRRRRERLRRRRLLARHVRSAAPAAPRSARAGAPVSRSKTNRNPCLLGLRHDVDVAAVVPHGQQLRRRAAGRSPTDRDARSGSARAACRVRASSATRLLANRLSPWRLPP